MQLSGASAHQNSHASCRTIHGEEIIGVEVGRAAGCTHWHSDLDIIAIKFKCCGEWYACYECHSDLAGHPATLWPDNERNAKAVFCGGCGHRLTIVEYLESGSVCPECGSGFNPGCARHHHLYFA